jgi:hypothetical protein
VRAEARLAVLAEVIGAEHPVTDRAVKLGDGERGRGSGRSPDEMAGQAGQQLGGDRAEQPLDLSTTLGPRDR